MSLSFPQSPRVLQLLDSQPHRVERQGSCHQRCCSPRLAAASGPGVQCLSMAMPPRLDSAGKVMERVSIWEFLQRSGERALSSSAARRQPWQVDFTYFSAYQSLFTCGFHCWPELIIFVLSVVVKAFFLGYSPATSLRVIVCFLSFHPFSSSR